MKYIKLKMWGCLAFFIIFTTTWWHNKFILLEKWYIYIYIYQLYLVDTRVRLREDGKVVNGKDKCSYTKPFSYIQYMHLRNPCNFDSKNGLFLVVGRLKGQER